MVRSTEIHLPQIEQHHVPRLEAGESAIVLQRHEAFEKNIDSPMAGSLTTEGITTAYERNISFFRELLKDDSENKTMLLFVSSDTQYADNGYRSIETAMLAEETAALAFAELSIDPHERILNLNPDFFIPGFNSTPVRPEEGLREPQIFDNPEYLTYLRSKYGDIGPGLTQAAWAAHESDAEQKVRERFGAEGVNDIVDRTKATLRTLTDFASGFHLVNPGRKLIIWAATHYDTISPLVKEATQTSFDSYVPVDYGGGIIIELKKDSEPVFTLDDERMAIKLGHEALTKISPL